MAWVVLGFSNTLKGSGFPQRACYAAIVQMVQIQKRIFLGDYYFLVGLALEFRRRL
jgi:hypothetical protein